MLVDEKLTFQTEISARVKKANSLVGLIRRSFTFLDGETFLRLYKSLVRPHLEYAAAVWCPTWRKDLTRLEAVQRRATKQVPGLHSLSYPERLRKLGLPTLEFRRLRGDLIETFKIVQGIYNITATDFFTFANSNTRGHSKKIVKPSTNSTIRTNSFSFRTISHWNSLPEDIICAPTLNTFKNRLDKHWKDHPLLYNTSA